MIFTDTMIRETMKKSRTMTSSEAISIIKGLPIVRYSDIKNTSCDINDALELAIEALDKRVAKKPEQRNEMDFCPNCGHWFDELYDVLFCPDCGQRIDWSE